MNFESMYTFEIDDSFDHKKVNEIKEWCVDNLDPSGFYFYPAKPALNRKAVFKFHSVSQATLFKIKYDEFLAESKNNEEDQSTA